MKISKYYYLIAVVCGFLAMAGCEDDDGPLRPGEVIGQPQEIDPDFEFPKDREEPLKRDLVNSVKKPRTPIENLTIRGAMNDENEDSQVISDIEIIADNVRSATQSGVERDVIVFDYGEMTLLGLQELIIPDISKETIDGSILLAFYNPSDEEETAWYQMPGISSSGLYNIRTSLYQRDSNFLFVIKTMFPSGVPYKDSVTFRGVKIYIFT